MKTFKIIITEADYRETISQARDLFRALPGTEEFEEREFLLVLIKDYEYRTFEVPKIE